MPRFLIEITHEDEHEACVKALHALHTLGSHLVTHAEYGCEDGVHACWLIVELDDREQAELMVPPEFRADARVVQLQRYSPEQIESMLERLSG